MVKNKLQVITIFVELSLGLFIVILPHHHNKEIPYKNGEQEVRLRCVALSIR